MKSFGDLVRGMLPKREEDSLYPLVSERLTLRPPVEDDFDKLYDLYRRDEVNRYLRWQSWNEIETLQHIRDRKRPTAIDAADGRIDLIVHRREDEQFVGDVCLFWGSQIGEVGWAFHPEQRGNGYATEAAAMMVQLGFTAVGLQRIQARCDSRNVASSRVMERLGMVREGCLRRSVLVKGEFCDELFYSMLREEWVREQV